MSTLDARLDEIARKACAQELPHCDLTRTDVSLIAEFLARQKLTQDHINDSVHSFAAMTHLLMPSDTVHDFIVHACREKPMPAVFRRNASVLHVPGWAEDDEPMTKLDASGTLDRVASMSKFTKPEVMAALKIAKECPDLPLTFMYFQTLLEQYFEEIRTRIEVVDLERAKSLEKFQIHWTAAANFMRFFFTALSQELPKDCGNSVFDLVDQERITDAFDRLDSYKAFEFTTPAFDLLGISPRTFVCPAKQFLRDMMVKNGTFMHAVSRVRLLRAGQCLHPSDGAMRSLATTAIVNVAKMTEAVIETGGKKAFSILSGGTAGVAS